MRTRKSKPIVSIGDKFGKLTVISDPYLIETSKNHRRQHVDCQCECGEFKRKINSQNLKNGSVLKYCSKKCKYYLEDYPITKIVPEESKLVKLNQKINYLTVTKEAFYYQHKGESNRHKTVEVKCDCGNLKYFREDKFAKGTYKSCGCKWEKKQLTGKTKLCKYCNKEKDISKLSSSNQCDDCRKLKMISYVYDISIEEYQNLLTKSNGRCIICKSDEKLCVDHCHKTNKVRGILCNSCNTGLGFFLDDIGRLNSAIQYLLEFENEV